MPRPRKPSALKQGNSETKAELALRAEVEKQLLGNSNLLEEVPDHLDERAQGYYKFLITELAVSGILSNLDITVLEQTADCMSKMREADEILKERGSMFIETMNPRTNFLEIKEHPAVNTKMKYLTHFNKLSSQLGLSPAARASLAGMQMEKEQTDNDPLLKILGER